MPEVDSLVQYRGVTRAVEEEEMALEIRGARGEQAPKSGVATPKSYLSEGETSAAKFPDRRGNS